MTQVLKREENVMSRIVRTKKSFLHHLSVFSHILIYLVYTVLSNVANIHCVGFLFSFLFFTRILNLDILVLLCPKI